MKIEFFGATGTVTGSRYLLTSGNKRILVDCGLFQGLKNLRERNWEPFPVDASSIDAVVLTHAHIDHSGYLPALARQGFNGPIICSPATAGLCTILLRDSAHLQEAEARIATRRQSSKHNPALPLYTSADAEAAIALLEPHPFDTDVSISGFTVRFRHAGHILGASSAYISDGNTSIAFSGDLGRCNDIMMLPPKPFAGADYVVIESTYGDRTHAEPPSDRELGEPVARTLRRQGTVVIPAFAVGRAQLLMYSLDAMRSAGQIPDVRIFVDSPMASSVTRVLHEHTDELRLSAKTIDELMKRIRLTESVEESKQLDKSSEPKIIIAGSGMATGGRVLFHLERYAPDARNLIVIAGYQAAGTRGAAIVRGASDIKVFGRFVPIRAEVATMTTMSSHADSPELIAWLRGAQEAPVRVFVTHGEPEQSDSLRKRIKCELGWEVTVPRDGQAFELVPRASRQAPKAERVVVTV